jgi:hypothetical protein
MVQAIDRLRLIHSERKKTVFILCNIPLDLPVDDLVTWRELVGDGRLTEALAACEENGWEALPLAAKELTRVFPKLWGTEKAAENWLRKNPPKSCISIILLGFGGFLRVGPALDRCCPRSPIARRLRFRSGFRSVLSEPMKWPRSV